MMSRLIKKLFLLVLVCGLMFEFVYAANNSKKEKIEEKLKQKDYVITSIGKENVLYLVSRFANIINADLESEEYMFESFEVEDYVYAGKIDADDEDTGIIVIYLTLDSVDDAKEMLTKTCNSKTEDKIKEAFDDNFEENIEDYDVNCESDDYFEYMMKIKQDDEVTEVHINASRKANTILFAIGSNVEKEEVDKIISYLGYSKQNNGFAYLGIFILIIITIIIVFAVRRKNTA